MKALSVQSLREQYKQATLTPTELVEGLWSKLEKEDSAIWIHRIARESLLQRASDLENSSPQDLPLFGIPFAVKDNIDVAGCPTSAGCPDFTYQAEENAWVVKLLLEAGGLLIGKTNMDQFATGLVGTRSPYGVPANAFDPKFIPGGSSSGSAVALAKGLVSFSLGTDTAGSGRVPASFQNLLGFKPTRGRLSCRGIVPACRSLDCVSVFGLQTSELAIIEKVLAVHDSKDPFSRKMPGLGSPKLGDVPRVAILPPEQLEFFGDALAQDAYNESLKVLCQAGLNLEILDMSPFLEAAELLYEGPWVAERHLATHPLIEQSPESFQPETLAVIREGKKPLALDAFKAQYRLAEYRRQTESVWQKFDFLALPTTGTIYTRKDIAKDPIRLNSNLGRYTNFMNLLDLCGCAVPTAFRADGLPSGLTLMAPAFQDQAVLEWAGRVHHTAKTGAGLDRGFDPESFTPSNGADSLIELFVCGAHMNGLSLNHQLTDLGSEFARTTRTAPAYRMYLLPSSGILPERPGLVRCGETTQPVRGEIWRMPSENFGAFMTKVSYPLGISQVLLEDGSLVYGFCCDPSGTEGCEELTHHGGWRAYLENTKEVNEL